MTALPQTTAASLPQSAASSPSWAAYMRTLFASRQPSLVGTADIDKLEQAAREKLKDDKGTFLCVFGGAGTGATMEENRRQFAKWKIIPRMLRDATQRNIETTLFGVKYPSPLLIAPMGVQGILDPDGECATARAAGQLGIPYVMSSVSTRSIEAVAEACGTGPRWFQLYWPKSNDLTLSLLSRAKRSGFNALVVTLDTVLLGWRPHDLDNSYLPYVHGVGVQVGLTDPVFMSKFGLEPEPEDVRTAFPYVSAREDALLRNDDEGAKARALMGMRFIGEVSSGVFRVWKELSFIKDNWDGPLILKGIMSIEDAELAIDHGVDGIIVSNHGGRQLDGSISALYALQQIMQSPKVRQAQADGKFTVLFDSGIRTGSDILKAIAIGAQGVLYGRPILYALAVAGQAGVDAQLRTILADFDIALALSGYADLAHIHGKADKILVRD